MCCGPFARARTLLYVAYFLLFLDLLIWLPGFVGGGIYIATRCAEELDFHVSLAFSHFFGTAAVVATVWEWWAKMQGETPELPSTLPLYWVVGVLVTLSTDSFLLIGNVLNPEPSTECTFRTLHKTLEGAAVAVDVLSLLWFFCVTAATWRRQRKMARARHEVLGTEAVYTMNAPIKL